MADSSGNGTPVTLLVPAQATTPTVVHHPTTQPSSHLPFTGLDALTALTLAVLLLVAGFVLVVTGHRPSPRRI